MELFPKYLSQVNVWADFWPLPVFALSYGYGVARVLLGNRPLARHVAIVFSAVAATGLSAGLMTGLSREAAVGDVLPAILSLIGGVAIYMASTGASVRRMIVSVAVFSLATTLWLGALWGASARHEFEMWTTNFSFLAEQERTRHAIELLKLKNELEIAQLRAVGERLLASELGASATLPETSE